MKKKNMSQKIVENTKNQSANIPVLVCGSGWTGLTCLTTPAFIPEKCY